VEARRSVTAGHGSVTTGPPVRGHGPSRPVTSLRVWSRKSRRRAGGPGPLALATLESLVHERLACPTGVRSLCAARAATSALRCSAFGRVAAHVTQRSRLRSKISQGTKFPLPGSSCDAAIGARIVPWRQQNDWAVNHPFAFAALSAPIPTMQLRPNVAVSVTEAIPYRTGPWESKAAENRPSFWRVQCAVCRRRSALTQLTSALRIRIQQGSNSLSGLAGRSCGLGWKICCMWPRPVPTKEGAAIGLPLVARGVQTRHSGVPEPDVWPSDRQPTIPNHPKCSLSNGPATLWRLLNWVQALAVAGRVRLL
jgi:hypothetical protein